MSKSHGWSNAGIYIALHQMVGAKGESEALTQALRWFVSLEEMMKLGNLSQKIACRRLSVPIEQFILDIRKAPVDRGDE